MQIRTLLAAAAAVLLALLALPMLSPASAAGERKVNLKSIKAVKCADDAGKKPCNKAVHKVAAHLTEVVKRYLKDARFTCGAGSPENLAVTIFWDQNEGWADVEGGEAALEKLPTCMREEFVPRVVEELSPIHYAVKAEAPSVHIRYYLKVSVRLE